MNYLNLLFDLVTAFQIIYRIVVIISQTAAVTILITVTNKVIGIIIIIKIHLRSHLLNC